MLRSFFKRRHASTVLADTGSVLRSGAGAGAVVVCADQPGPAAAHPLLMGWSPEELALLTELQLDTAPRPLAVREPTLPTEPGVRPPLREDWPKPYQSFIYRDTGEHLPVDESLPLLRFLTPGCGTVVDTLSPVVEVEPPPASDIGGMTPVYYFEFDTVDSFDSPNFWR